MTRPIMIQGTMSNALSRMGPVGLRYVDSADALKKPDLIILPGTKNTLADLIWLRQNGLEAAVKKHASRGTLIIGICGGYQMLGMTLHDPDNHRRRRVPFRYIV